MGPFRFLARVIIGLLFVGHGTQKLFGWFGGGGLDGTSDMFDSIGLQPGRRNALVAGAAEAGGGLLFAFGAATPLADLEARTRPRRGVPWQPQTTSDPDFAHSAPSRAAM